jgi:hypothetical protein
MDYDKFRKDTEEIIKYSNDNFPKLFELLTSSVKPTVPKVTYKLTEEEEKKNWKGS